jgi:hypothetical protein
MQGRRAPPLAPGRPGRPSPPPKAPTAPDYVNWPDPAEMVSLDPFYQHELSWQFSDGGYMPIGLLCTQSILITWPNNTFHGVYEDTVSGGAGQP